MIINLWGVRGSIPTFNPQTMRYGGHTSCVEVTEAGSLLVLDAGSGIQHLNQSPHLELDRIDILLTHLHIDHIQGLGIFKPLFDPSKEVHIWGPKTNGPSLRTRLGRYFSPPLFPVYFRNLNCKLTIHEIENSQFTIGPFSIQSQYIIHPGPTVGYRVQTARGVLTFIPDHEPALGQGGMPGNIQWLSGSDLASGADLLLHDAQYTSEEYQAKIGWGHCAMEDAIRLAEMSSVKQLYLMHHDPNHTDAQLDEYYQRLRHHISTPVSYTMAIEGSRIEW
jgi:phosphoribosyl 1,2-cyclic phosphodiesterase